MIVQGARDDPREDRPGKARHFRTERSRAHAVGLEQCELQPVEPLRQRRDSTLANGEQLPVVSGVTCFGVEARQVDVRRSEGGVERDGAGERAERALVGIGNAKDPSSVVKRIAEVEPAFRVVGRETR